MPLIRMEPWQSKRCPTNKKLCGAQPPHNSGLNKPGGGGVLCGVSMERRFYGRAERLRARRLQRGSKMPHNHIAAVLQWGMNLWGTVMTGGIDGIFVRRQEISCQAVLA